MNETSPAEMGPRPIWFVIFGIVLIIAGFAAIIFPLASTIAFKIMVGWVLLIVGVGYLVSAFRSDHKPGRTTNILLGLLFVIVGVWLAFSLFEGIIGLTILLAASFIVQGGVEISDAWSRRPHHGWGWLMFSGIISVLAGVLLFIGLPSTAVWALGLLVGINLLSSGLYFLALGGALKGMKS